MAGKRIDKTLTILDVKGVSVLKALVGKTLDFLKLTIKITGDNYPETMG